MEARCVAAPAWRTLSVLFVVASLGAAGSAGIGQPPAPVAVCAVPELALGDGCPDDQIHIPAVPSFDGFGAITATASPTDDVVYVIAGNALQNKLMLHRIGTAVHVDDYPLGTGFQGSATMFPLAAAVSHDGDLVAVVAAHPESAGGWTVMFDTETGGVRWAQPFVGGNPARTLAFSPTDGLLMVAGGQGSAFAAAHDVANGTIVWTRSWNALGGAEWDIAWNLAASLNRFIVVGTSAGDERDIVYHLMDPATGETLGHDRIDTGWNEWAKSVVLAPDGRTAYIGFHQGVIAVPLHRAGGSWTTFVPLAGGFTDEWPTALALTPDGGSLLHLGQEVIGGVVQRLDAATGQVEWLARPIVPEAQLWTDVALTPNGAALYLSGIGYTVIDSLPVGPSTVAEMHLTLERFDALDGGRSLPYRADASPIGWESTWTVAATDGGAALAGVALPTLSEHGTGDGVALAYWDD